MDTITQIVTIAAVLLGALMTYATNQLMERSKQRESLRIRWDEQKLNAYVEFVGRTRAVIHAAVMLYEVREDMRELPRSLADLSMDLTDAGGLRVLAFERVMLLGGDVVIEAAHAVSEAIAAIEWQARGVVDGTLADWRDLHIEAFRSINVFHQRARADLGVAGAFEGEQHTARGLLLPHSRTQE